MVSKLSSQEIQFLKARAEDVDSIIELAKSIWWKHYPEIIGEAQVEFMLNKMYSHEVVKSHITNQTQLFYLIKVEGENCGFLAVEETSETELFLQKFYILQNTQNKGLGTLAFKKLIQQYPLVETIRLQVNRQNIKPINFYFKLGFTIEKSADFDIGDGYFMNDFVMVNHIKK
ncbi:MAG: GNAT family N-acetyltransferase [Bacteroidia bacterium]